MQDHHAFRTPLDNPAKPFGRNVVASGRTPGLGGPPDPPAGRTPPTARCFRSDLLRPGLRSAVLAGAFEGYETWLIGFDGPGCLTVTLAADGSLEVRVTHQCGC